MITALEAKIKAFRKKYGNFVENRIIEAASNGEMFCVIYNLSDALLNEITGILYELGYSTLIDEHNQSLTIFWTIKNPDIYRDEMNLEELVN